MSTGYDLAGIRTPSLDLIVARAGNAALLRGYNAPRPATGAALSGQTLLFEEVCGAPFGTTTGAVLTITNPTPANALASGQWAWWRVVKADGTSFVMDGDSADFSLSGSNTQAGQPVTLTGLTITEGNP
jgi:hypothetical protein